MQREKALLPISGRPLIETIIAQISPHFSEIIISVTSREKFSFLGLRIVEDEKPGQGPLLAILSALRISRCPSNFVLACDIPFIHIPFLQKMLGLALDHEIVVPRYRDGKYEPLFAVYDRSVIPAIEGQIRSGNRRISSLFQTCRTAFVSMDRQKWFKNLNTLKEYHDYLQSEKKAASL